MELKRLDKEELAALYRDEMMEDFPHSELKPLSAMLRLMDMGRYDPLLITQDGQAVGYAMLWLAGDRSGALLEYFGVLRGLRSAGQGSRILSMLSGRYGQLFGEAEAPCSHDPDINELRQRRLACVRCTCNQNNHTHPPISDFYLPLSLLRARTCSSLFIFIQSIIIRFQIIHHLTKPSLGIVKRPVIDNRRHFLLK